MRITGALLLFLIIFAVWSVGGGSVNTDVVEGLRPKKAACIENVAKLERSGTLRIGRGEKDVDVTYNERVWSRLVHDDRVRQSLLVYCAHMPDDGRLSVYVWGLYDHKILASVINGHYSD